MNPKERERERKKRRDREKEKEGKTGKRDAQKRTKDGVDAVASCLSCPQDLRGGHSCKKMYSRDGP